MNKTLKLLLLSDLFVLTGFGLIDPILAIFINDNLINGTIFAAGFASTLFLLTKCIVQLPFSRYVDKHGNKKTWMLIGTLLMTLVPLFYIFAKDVKIIYFAQILHGLASGLAYPTWLSLWSVNLEKKKEAFQWSIYSTFIGIGTAITGAIGAGLAQLVGFKFTFITVSIMSLIGGLILLLLEIEEEHKKIKKKKVLKNT